MLVPARSDDDEIVFLCGRDCFLRERPFEEHRADLWGPFTALTMEVSQLLPSAAMYRSAGISRPLRSKNGSNERRASASISICAAWTGKIDCASISFRFDHCSARLRQ